MNNQVKLIEGIRAKLEGQNESVEVVAIDLRSKTFTWMFRGHLENTESFDAVEYWELPDTPPVPTIKPEDSVYHKRFKVQGKVKKISASGKRAYVVWFDGYVPSYVSLDSLEVVE